MNNPERREQQTTEQTLAKIRLRMQSASQNLIEEEPGWVISESLRQTNPAGCRVYSPESGIVKEADYKLFLHAAEDIRYLLVLVEKLGINPIEMPESIHTDEESRHSR